MTPHDVEIFQPLETWRASNQRTSNHTVALVEEARSSSKIIVLGGGFDDPRRSSKVLLHDGLPPDVWDDLVTHANGIYFALMFLTASVMWAYYACVVAQDFYAKKFPDIELSFMTTMATSWPNLLVQILQIVSGLDKKISANTRITWAYCAFILMAVAIILCSMVDWPSQQMGAAVLLTCFAIVGAASALSQSVLYALAAQFPMERFTNAVQIGNVWAGVVNVTLTTIVRLAVGGIQQSGDSQTSSFYLSFSLLGLVCIGGMATFYWLVRLPCIEYLLNRHKEDTHIMYSLPEEAKWHNYKRLARIIWQPALAQFITFFFALSVYPGIGCDVDRVLALDDVGTKWFCSPGVVASTNFGDCMGRLMCTAAIYRIFTMHRSLVFAFARIAFLPLMTMGVAQSSLYVFAGVDPVVVLSYGLVMDLLQGITAGLLSTVTMGAAPLMVDPEDRDVVSSIMVLALFSGQACGATTGLLISEVAFLGL